MEDILSMFGIDDISSETEDTLKKRYKKLMIKYHPDNCKDSDYAIKMCNLVNTGYDRLKKVLREVITYNNNVKTIIVSFRDIVKLCNSDIIASGQHVLTKSDVLKNNTIVDFCGDITIGNEEYSLNDACVYDRMGNYIINVKIYVDNWNSIYKQNIQVKIGDYVGYSIVCSRYCTVTVNCNNKIRIVCNIHINDKQE